MKLLPHWKIALIEMFWPLLLFKYKRREIDRIILTRRVDWAKRKPPYCDTSDYIATLMASEAHKYFFSNKLPSPTSFLDPSCGKGRLIKRMMMLFGAGKFVGIEKYTDEHSAELSLLARRSRHFKEIKFEIISGDFLKDHPTGGQFDVVLLNPPYNGRKYERHFVLAWLCAKQENAIIVGLMPTAALTRPMGGDFRKWLSAVGATWKDMGTTVCNYPVPVSMVVIQQSVKK